MTRSIPAILQLLLVAGLLSRSGLLRGQEWTPDGTYHGVELLPAGAPQTWPVVADFNADGRDDVVLVLRTGEGLTLFLSRETGDHERRTVEAEFVNAFHAIAGHIDPDGLLDLIVCEQAGARLFHGDGDGSFREDDQRLPAVFFGRTVALEDLDKDGLPDVVLGDYLAGHVLVFRGSSEGGFLLPGQPSLINSEPHDLDLADFNEDGVADLVCVTGNGNSLGYLSGNADGTFGPTAFTDLPGEGELLQAAVGDMDGDGHVDVAVADRLDSEIQVLYGRGDGTLEAPLSIATAEKPQVLQLLDFNGDGRQDIVVAAGEDAGLLALHTGRGDGTFRKPLITSVGSSPVGLGAGDLDGDSLPDVVVTNETSSFACIVRAGGDGRPELPFHLHTGEGPTAFVASDLDEDSRVDLAVSRRNTPGLVLYRGQEGLDFAPGVEIPAEVIPVALTAGDVDGDGIPDLAAVDLVQGLTIWPAVGAGNFDQPLSLGAGVLPGALALGHLAGDEHVDIAVVNRGSGNVTMLAGRGSWQFAGPTSFAVGSRPTDILWGDLNGDDMEDLVTVNEGSADLSVLLGQSPEGFRPDQRVPAGQRPVAAVAGDLDGDGLLDLAVVDADLDRFLTFGGRGDGTFEAARATSTGPSPGALALTDPGQDGFPDVVVASLARGAVFVHANDGAGAFPAFHAYATGGNSAGVECVDVSGDGVPDIITADSLSGRITILVAGTDAPPEEPGFLRGQVNEDEKLDLSDAVALLGFLFLGGSIRDCPDAADANDDGKVDLSDAIGILTFLFLGGEPLPSPSGESCGTDPTADSLGRCFEPCL